MSFKVYCDSCGEEPDMKNGFMFEAQVKEVVDAVEFTGRKFQDQKKMIQSQFQLCQKCYKEKFLTFIKEGV